MNLLEKFSKYLPDILDDNECWEWQGKIDAHGYGYICRNKKTLKAHRISYEIHYAEPLGNLHCLHRCDNPKCVNPSHLFSGTNLDNVKDKVNKGRCYTGNQKGENNGASRLKNTDVIRIRQLYKSDNYTTIKLAEMYNVHRSTISYVVNNKTFKHLLED
jgi:hypothetical protein